MADLLVDPVIEKLINFGFEYLKDQVRWQTGMKEELESLRQKHPQIQAVVKYASSQEQIKDPALNEWLWQLRAAIDEADDVMDEFEYLKLKEQLTIKMEKTKKGKFCSISESASKILKRALKNDPTLKRLEEVVHKLAKVSAGAPTFLQLAKEAKQDHKEQRLELYRARETGSVPKNDQIGRGVEKEFVIKWLRKTPNEDQTTLHMHSNISVLSIVGQGGMGKTTLLQHVYKEVKIDESDEKEFDLKIWVCVSNNFDKKRVIADMLESVKNKRPRLDSLNALQETLMSTVKSKKFLLVMDDIWEEEEDKELLNISKWKDVLAPLASGKLGSKILVTTRMKSVALMLSKVINKEEEILPLEGLKYEECLQLFYASANVENLINDHPNLMSIAEKIVEKLSGSPLAARIIGGVIDSSLDEGLWKKVLNYDIGRHNDISSILKLSYIFLPKVLRNCLSFCCTFPQDYEFLKKDLVRMWMALGFIQSSSNQGETVNDLGERYFDILVKKSLIDIFQTGYTPYKFESYKLHDLIHEMLRVVSSQECFSIVGDIVSDENLLLRNSKTIQHLFVKTSNIDVLRKVEKFTNLRSLHLSYDENSEDDVDVLAKIFKTSRSIRLMRIVAPKLKQMPKEIGDLIHLRNLVLYIDTLPKNMNNLLCLHYLVVPFPGIYEIGKLNSLKELNSFYVLNKDGYRIEELQHMNELHVLKIEFRENLKDAKDAYSAKLLDKRKLIELSLHWNRHISDAVAGLNENVLDNLQPHSNLKKLMIHSFKGVRSAIWMNNVDLISNLVQINLAFCEGWQTLPPFWQLPFLKYLYLYEMTKAKGFDCTFHGNFKVRVFPSLQVLYIRRLEALEDWFVATATSYECLFPCLTQLRLLNCPNLLELPALPPKLEKLEICSIGWKGSNWLQGIHNYCSILIQDCPNLIFLKGHQEMETAEKCQLILSELIINDPSLLLMAPLKSVTSIKKLKIKDNDALISFPIEAKQWFVQASSSLCDLAFSSLKLLSHLPSYLESLSSLKILSVEEVPLLQLLPNMPDSLEQLKLVYLESLQFLPSSLESLSLLKILHVKYVPHLQLLPNMPASLKELKLEELDSLQCLPSTLSFSSLEHLYLRSIPLQELPDLPTSLCVLDLSGLSSLHCLPFWLPCLSSLKDLGLRCMPQLQELPDLPPSLCKLNLSGLSKLPSCLPNLSSLQTLHIWWYHQLQELPDLPLSLKSLEIHGCHPELKKRYQRDRGSNWHKIAHIPYVIIDAFEN